mgnify:CR=1 FL=1
MTHFTANAQGVCEAAVAIDNMSKSGLDNDRKALLAEVQSLLFRIAGPMNDTEHEQKAKGTYVVQVSGIGVTLRVGDEVNSHNRRHLPIGTKVQCGLDVGRIVEGGTAWDRDQWPRYVEHDKAVHAVTILAFPKETT